jgi:hypothetical protein
LVGGGGTLLSVDHEPCDEHGLFVCVCMYFCGQTGVVCKCLHHESGFAICREGRHRWQKRTALVPNLLVWY